MAARIEVEKLKDGEFRVRVIEGRSESTHRVHISEDDYRRICAGKIEAGELIRRSFEFLLAREPKEIHPAGVRFGGDRALLPRIRART